MQKIALCNPNAVVFDDPAVLPYAQSVRLSPPAFGFVTKMLIVMKLTIVFFLVGLLNTYAVGFTQTITFSGKNVPLARVFSVVEKQTGFNIFSNKELLQKSRPVSLEVVNMPLSDFLDLAFHDQPISYAINNNTIFIKEKPEIAAQPTVNQLLLPELQNEINGTVLNIDKEPLEGATITIKGTDISTTTKSGGKFTLAAEPGQTLIISYIGYQTQELRIRNRNTIQIILQKEVKEIEEVVVTALGIKRKVKALTYNVQEIKSEELNAVSDGSLVSGLAGKIAGATINNSSAGTGSSSRVILRGLKSLDGNNNALYVIDGIPMTNTIRTQAEDIYSGAGQSGDFVANLNPEDIESLSVLSGPAAAALYGSAAANGVIVINTKRGQTGKTSISVTSNTSFSSPFVLPEFQNTYGVSEIGSYYSWGDKLATPSDYKPTDFFETGVNTNSSLSFSTGTERNQTYLSLGNVISTGIIPNNKFGRTNLTVRNTSSFFNDKLNLDISFMTGVVDERNMISQGQYFNPLVAVYLFPPGEDFNKVRAFERYDATRNLLTQSWLFGDNGLMMQNPYWVARRDIFKNKKERYLTTLSLRYHIADWISLSGRVRLDKGDEKAEKRFAASTNKLFASENGFYGLNTLNTRQLYAEGLVSINQALSKDYHLTANLGAAIDDVRFDQYLNSGKLGYVANMYSFGNIDKSTAEMRQTGYVKQKQSVFGTVQLSFRNMVFLDLTSRNDWASTLVNTTSPGFFYPSVGLSAIITDLYNINSKALSFLKIRGSYSEVGNEPKEFLTILYSEVEGNYPGEIKRMFNPDLKAELTKSFELGMNALLFNGKFRLDATLYSTRTYNQFFEPIISVASGSKTVVVNGGRVDNKGVELSARYTGYIGRVNWTSYVNYSLNRNKIVRMLENWKNPIDGKTGNLDTLDMFGTGSYKMVNMKGGSMGDIYVNTLKVDEHGAIYVDPGSQTVLPEPNKFIYAGNNNPKYTVSWGNNISWKGVALGFMFNARVGGIVVSSTKAIMDAFGVSKSSAEARDAGGALVNGRPVPAKEYYSVVGAGASGGIASMYTYSATNVRLGEVTLGYDIPVRKLVKFISSANVSLIGRNLFMFYNTAPFDPELTANTQTYFQGIDYFMMPSLRSLGFSIKLNF